MLTYSTKKDLYQIPFCSVLEVSTEGVLCESQGGTVGDVNNEDFHW